MNETRRTNRLGMIALLSVILGVGILFAGCDKAPQGEKKPSNKVETEPSSHAALPKKDLISIGKIEACDDLFVLHDMEKAYEQNEDRSDAVLKALVQKRDQLVAGHERQTAIEDRLDFVAFEFKRVAGEKYRLRWYYIVTGDITKEWKLNPTLTVDESHIPMLPEERRKAGNFNEAIHPATSDITNWKAGQHRVLDLNIDLPEVPFNITTRFYQWLPDKPQLFTKPIQHGWYIDLKE